MAEILFLGTGASLPSRDRSPSCVAVRLKRDIALFDCGEGAQRQMMLSPFSFMKVACILITHMHGDHVFGLPGIIQTMSMSGRKEPLTVCGPEGIREYLDAVLSICEGNICYQLDVVEVSPGYEVEFREFSVSVFETDHVVASVGYVLREHDQKGRFDREKAISLGLSPGPDFARLRDGDTVNGVAPDSVIEPPAKGLSVVYSGDTAPCKGLDDAALGTDILIHEATYADSEKHMAAKFKHSTSLQAAELAKKSGCRHLFITHVSNRYDDRKMLEAEARETFPDTDLAEDFRLFLVTKDSVRSV
ncbi:MAG: ribonuclease Z [Candidatus Methanoplasma sp.]|jgi:ribonuclease Z|nr:ribonuclease Z [Candidatus Methanoplasma sp.]